MILFLNKPNLKTWRPHKSAQAIELSNELPYYFYTVFSFLLVQLTFLIVNLFFVTFDFHLFL